ncbi:unnamed protein product [Adineta steineri]|uniref:G-protein coupled receptors family 1 profile domain-containing protein n=1 Tax=Adineta steineri TaxID=433720 RepID=A0A818ZVB2_9BILA|nr:unnamed protein product [Adineta steineri]CAF3774442.1 unnamed protein product [Adineta steineri]
MVNNSTLSFLDLVKTYATTHMTLSDLYTYEVIILLIYGVIIIFSFFTNSIAIIIFLIGRRSRSELSPFLLNLSVFNIIMTVYCIPFTITSVIFQRWIYAGELCIVLDAFKTFSVSGVLLTLITIAIDRYCAVKYPLATKVYSVFKKNLIALSVIWILSLGLTILRLPARSIPIHEIRLWINSRELFSIYIDSLENATETLESIYLSKQLRYQLVDTIQCVPNTKAKSFEVRLTILNSLQTYFFPLFILAFVYLRIAAMLWQRSNDGHIEFNGTTVTNNLYTHESVQFKKKLKQGLKMLVAVVILYAVLWLPMNLFQLCLNLLCYIGTPYQDFCSNSTLLKLLYISSHFLTVSNTALNPIIYGFANNRFRSDIRHLKRRIFHCQGRTSFYFLAKGSRRTSYTLEERFRDVRNNQNPLKTNRNLSMPRQKPINMNNLLTEDSLKNLRHST